jgi:hypothetical protein
MVRCEIDFMYTFARNTLWLMIPIPKFVIDRNAVAAYENVRGRLDQNLIRPNHGPPSSPKASPFKPKAGPLTMQSGQCFEHVWETV